MMCSVMWRLLCRSMTHGYLLQFFLLLLNLLQCAHGSGFFELQVLEMVNPRGELSSGECCGGGTRSPVSGRCATPCNTFFRLCLKEYQSNVTSTGSCSFGNTSSVVLGRDSFTLADPERGKLVLPFTFRWTEFLVSAAAAGLVGVSESSKSRYVESVKPVVQRPYFDDVGPRNVTAVVGQSALLNCRVKHPGDRTVSWMRKRDLHILTSSIHTYTGDARFSVRHPEHSDDWDLRIAYVQKRDAGVYECQVNTEPKINLAIMLNVEDAQATISGPGEVYVKKGSTISLTCSVNVHSTPPSSVLWYHGHSVVDFDSPRGGISLETEKTEAGTTSKLLVTKALLSDSGNYTCMPSNASPASAVVHVLNGEHPAAMQTSQAGVRRQMALLATLSLLVVTVVR